MLQSHKIRELFILSVIGMISFLFFHCFYSCHLFYKEQLMLFLYTPDYLASYFNKPSGVANLLGDFLTQFYCLNYIGPLLISSVLMGQWWLIYRILYKQRPETKVAILAFLPVVVELGLHCTIDYTLSSTLSVVLALVCFWCYTLLKKRSVAQLLGALMIPVLYYSIGSSVYLFAFAVVLYELDGSKSNVLYCAFLLMLAFVCPILLRSYFLLTLSQAYVWPHPDARAFIPSILTLAGIACVMVRNRPTRIKSAWLERGLMAFVLLLGIGSVYCLADFKREKLLSLDHHVYLNQWDKVYALGQEYKIKDPIASYYLQIAAAKRGRLADELLRVHQKGADGLFLPVNYKATSMSIFFSHEVFYQLGDMNMAQHAAMLGMIFSPHSRSARMLQRLVEIHLINGENAVAQKYLRMLGATLFYRDWASKHKQLLTDPVASAWLIEKRSFIPSRDLLRRASDYESSLKLLIESNPTNNMALDYLLCYHLLHKNMPAFLAVYKEEYKDPTASFLPPLYQEALLVAFAAKKAPEKEVARYKIPDEMITRFMTYTRMYEAGGQADRSVMKAYASTYWYYYHFSTNEP